MGEATRVTQAGSGLVVSSISKSFGAVAAVQNVTIDCRLGEVVGLIGPNGAGKTTLINLITGVLKPDDGTIDLNGLHMLGRPAYKVAMLGIARTFQNIRLFDGLTVRENVEVAMVHNRRQGRRSQRSRTQRLLEDLRLDHIAERKAATLSYGHQRRVEIARALALDPAILLLDEPAAGANEVEADELLKALGRVRSETELGVLVVDHDLRFVWELSDRVYVLDHGEIIASGTPEQIRANQKVIDVYIGTDTSNTESGSNDRA